MTTADPATTLAPMSRIVLVDAATEAAIVGRSPARVSRARRTPGHPARLVLAMLAHQDGTLDPEDLDALRAARLVDGTGQPTPKGVRLLRDRVREGGPRARQALAPRDEILTWWPPAGGRWTVRQWHAFQRIAAGEDADHVETPSVVASLIGIGVIDTDRNVTPEGHRVLGRIAQEAAS